MDISVYGDPPPQTTAMLSILIAGGEHHFLSSYLLATRSKISSGPRWYVWNYSTYCNSLDAGN